MRFLPRRVQLHARRKYREADPPRAKKYYDMAADELRRAALEKEFLDDLCDEYAEKLGRAKALLDARRGA